MISMIEWVIFHDVAEGGMRRRRIRRVKAGHYMQRLMCAWLPVCHIQGPVIC
jgi:hypothetical protein